jgi:phosphoserine phosphatase RsbU/P
MSVTELLGGAIGCTLLALGGTSLVAWSLRRRPTDRALAYFGSWCCLYGVRLVAEQPFVRTTLGGSDQAWRYFLAFVTYAINVPSGLFLEALVGPGWKQSIRRVWQVQAVYAIGAMATDLLLGRPKAAMVLNSPIVLVGLAVALPNLWLLRHRLGRVFKTPAIAIGATIMALFVINENLSRPVVPDVNLEPIGVLAFMVSLGYGVVGSVIRNEAELVAVQRELETARQIQATLLPRVLPQVAGLDLAARYIPMTAVAGDLYDVVSLGPSQIGILVADVAGHGVPAALVASMVKVAFSAQADLVHDPARVLSGMNRILCRHVERTFVTAIYAVVDTDRRTITVASAGHPPMLVGRSDGTVDESHEHGLMLGFLPDAPYVNGRLELRPGDRVLMYTDGLTETQNAEGDFLDQEGVGRWLVSAQGANAPLLADAALKELRHWRGGPTFDDDLTFVVGRFASS